MPPQLSEDEIDDLLYHGRVGELQEFSTLSNELCEREHITMSELLLVAKDAYSGNGPVHMAAANEILATIIKALSAPSPQNPTQLSILNAQNAAGNTALHWAALNGHLECVKVLLDSGADPTIRNNVRHDAVYEAELNDKKEVVEWVLKESEGLEEGIGNSGEGEEEGDEDIREDKPERGSGVAPGGEETIREGIGSLGMKDGIEDS